MREKSPQLIITFHTTAEAMAMEKLCHQRGLPGKLISAPRALSADCGIAWRAPLESRDAIESMLTEEALEIHGIFELIC